MILIVVMRLDAPVLEPSKSTIGVLTLLLNLVQDVCWHAQETSCTDVTMVVGLHRYILTKNGIFYNKCCMIRECKVSLRIKCVDDMGTTSIFESLGFFPIHQLVVFCTIMAVMLQISSTVMPNKGIPIINVIDKGTRQPSSLSVRIKGFTQAPIGIVSVVGRRLVCYPWVIKSKCVSAVKSIKQNQSENFRARLETRSPLTLTFQNAHYRAKYSPPSDRVWLQIRRP